MTAADVDSGPVAERWRARLEAIAAVCRRQGGLATRTFTTPPAMTPLSVLPPASAAEVRAVEVRLGFRLPRSLRAVVRTMTAGIAFYWRLHDADGQQQDGACDWSLARLPEMEVARQEWVRACFLDIERPGHRRWQRALAFQEVGNGDMLAIDLAKAGRPVIYLNHEDERLHGWRLGDDFADFLERWTRLGCVGPEHWTLRPFLTSRTGGLDAEGAEARRWRADLGVLALR